MFGSKKDKKEKKGLFGFGKKKDKVGCANYHFLILRTTLNPIQLTLQLLQELPHLLTKILLHELAKIHPLRVIQTTIKVIYTFAQKIFTKMKKSKTTMKETTTSLLTLCTTTRYKIYSR